MGDTFKSQLKNLVYNKFKSMQSFDTILDDRYDVLTVKNAQTNM